MTIWITADDHFGHWTTVDRNIIKYCQRPFSTIAEMDNVLISNWNLLVRQYDDVYVLGDFCLGNASMVASYVSLLEGNIHLIPGHHDHYWRRKSDIPGLIRCPKIMILEYAGVKFLLSHHPMDFWAGRGHGTYLLHGHTHRVATDNFALNVGVDLWDFYPVRLSIILTYFETMKGDNNA